MFVYMTCFVAMKCDDALKVLIVEHLARFSVTTAAADEGHSAAVAVAVTDAGFGAALSGMPAHSDWQSHASLILTKRSSKLRNHPGQWALPGGRIDTGETPEQAALREMHEEVGLELDSSAILGRLDDFITRSGFIMTPIVVWIGPQRDLVPNEHEVDSIHRIPVTEFMREDAPMLDEAEDGGAPVLRMPVGNTWIAAPTAAILYQFREVCIGGRDTRVAHYEQPTFAWR
jgi:8-oxo-dGTP pyrophosphatase MutT (NUDIX family)